MIDNLSSSRRATINDVAKAAGVSIATVSRVLNKTGPVANETAARVYAAVAELNYIPQSAARILASQRTGMIGLLTSDISGDFFSDMLRGIEEGAVEGGFDLLVHSTRLSSQKEFPFRRVLAEHNTDGLIVFSDCLDEKELARLRTINFPVVLLYRSSPHGLDIPTVTIENTTGAYEITSHLIEAHDCRQIVFLQGPSEHEDSHQREAGYRQALEAHHIPFDPALVACGFFNPLDAYNAITHILAESIRFDAVFTGDDESASGVLKGLRQAGLRVPEDIAVVGFDDIYLANHLSPPLTTVRAFVQDAGRTAAEQLVRFIRTGKAESVVLPTQMIIRQSCGCPPLEGDVENEY